MMMRRSFLLSSKTMMMMSTTATPTKPNFEIIRRFGGPSSSLSLSSLSFSRRRGEEEHHHHRHRKVRTFAAASSSSSDDDGGGGGGGGNKSSTFVEEEEEFSSDSNIVDLELHVEARQSYLAYAMSVIVGRALPDVRDGLKPVHRRILYAMHELNLDHNKPFKKCARVVGEVLGKFHPHGDQSVYDALVRMAQDFSMSAPLVNGHGNFGSMDNDPPAAMRYTECKLRQLSQDMLLKDVEMDCVEFADTFDGSQQEPMVLPAKLPNVLINGSTGIAVGMATSIPPHNLMEVADALVVFARAAQKGEQVKLEELLRVMPGPDFPTGGVIFADNKDANDNNNNDKNDSGRSTSNRNALRNLYRDGRGGVTLRGVAEIVPRTKVSSRKRSGKTAKKDDKAAAEKSLDRDIVISSIPYMQNKATLVQQIADLVNNRQIEGVADVRDESDRDGVRVVVEMKRSGDAEAVLNSLYKRTKLQVKVNVNVTALVGLTPKVLGLMEVMQEFLDFRIDVIRKRAMYSLEKDRARMHIVEALLTVLEDTDAVIKMIRKSKDGKEAMENLREMKGLTTVQSEAVLQMPLRRLTSLESGKLVEERDQLLSSIKGNQNLLDNTSAVIDVVCEEALEVKKKHGIPRRTTIETDTSSSIEVEHEIPNNDSLIIFGRGNIGIDISIACILKRHSQSPCLKEPLVRTFAGFLDGGVVSHRLTVISTTGTSHRHGLHDEFIITKELIDQRFFVFALLGKPSQALRRSISEECELCHGSKRFLPDEKCFNVPHHGSRCRNNPFLFFNEGRIVRAVFHGDFLAHDNLVHRWNISKRAELLGELRFLFFIHLGFQARDRVLQISQHLAVMFLEFLPFRTQAHRRWFRRGKDRCR